MSYFRCGDPLDDFDRLDREQADYEKNLPECDHCGCKIHERYYSINGDEICRDCLEKEFGKDVD
jgi:hypothetical protein